MRFKQFEIRKPTYACPEKIDDEIKKYQFDVVKWSNDNKTCFSIATLIYNPKEPCFDMRSVGLRYLEHREEGLEEFIIQWCKTQSIVFKYEEDINSF